MRVLLDENLPEELRHHLTGHDVATVRWKGWKGLENGDLLRLAEQDFDVFITLDRGRLFQHDISNRNLGFIILIAQTNQIGSLLPLVPEILAAIPTVLPGEVIRVEKSGK
jgi:hypothetical protein